MILRQKNCCRIRSSYHKINHPLRSKEGLEVKINLLKLFLKTRGGKSLQLSISRGGWEFRFSVWSVNFFPHFLQGLCLLHPMVHEPAGNLQGHKTSRWSPPLLCAADSSSGLLVWRLCVQIPLDTGSWCVDVIYLDSFSIWAFLSHSNLGGRNTEIIMTLWQRASGDALARRRWINKPTQAVSCY